MIEAIFDGCVWLLILMAGWLGTSYEAINVWIFVIIWPLLTLGLVAVVIHQGVQIRSLRRELEA